MQLAYCTRTAGACMVMVMNCWMVVIAYTSHSTIQRTMQCLYYCTERTHVQIAILHMQQANSKIDA